MQPMPLNLGYVLSTYGIWLATFVIYIWATKHKLSQISEKGSDEHTS